MNFKHLYYFWAAAHAGGIGRAGTQLHITAQTLSGQIKLLEDALNKKLFKKSGRNLELTDAGRLALDYADEIFSLGAELEMPDNDAVVRLRLVAHPVEECVGVEVSHRSDAQLLDRGRQGDRELGDEPQRVGAVRPASDHGFEAYSMRGGLVRWASEERALEPGDGYVADH